MPGNCASYARPFSVQRPTEMRGCASKAARHMLNVGSMNDPRPRKRLMLDARRYALWMGSNQRSTAIDRRTAIDRGTAIERGTAIDRRTPHGRTVNDPL